MKNTIEVLDHGFVKLLKKVPKPLFHIKCPVFLAHYFRARKHELFPNEFYIPQREKLGIKYAKEWIDTLSKANSSSLLTYEMMEKEGIPRGMAKSVLPLGVYVGFYTFISPTTIYNLRQRGAGSEAGAYAESLIELVSGLGK